MPRVRLPDGRVLAFPEGMSQGDMEEALGKVPPVPQQAPVAAARPPETTNAAPAKGGPLFSSPKGFYGPGVLANVESRLTGKSPEQAYAQRVPQLEKTAGLVGSLVAPGRTVLGQMAGQAGVAGGLEALKGTGPASAATKAGEGAAGAGLVGGVLKGASRVTSGLQLPKVAEAVSSRLASYLKQNVPAYRGFEASGQGLKDMLYSQTGYNKLHRMYDRYLRNLVGEAEGKVIEMSPESAKKIGITAMRTPKMVGDIPTVEVDAGEAAKAITGKWHKSPEVYREVTGKLDALGLGDPKLRGAYKTAMGLREYLEGKIGPQGLDLMKAQAGLTKGGQVDKLLTRGLGEDVSKILMPGGAPVKKGSLAGPLGAAGATMGAAGGMIGGHGYGALASPLAALFGGYHGARLGGKIPTYSNLPPGALMQILQQLAPRAGGAAASQYGP